jgi:hypothetical protein
VKINTHRKETSDMTQTLIARPAPAIIREPSYFFIKTQTATTIRIRL